MNRGFLPSLAFVVVLCLGLASVAEAGPFFSPYWQLDARVQLVPQQVNVVVPTGYWGGNFTYPWLGFNYPAFYGPLYRYPGIYGAYPWLGGPYFYGFLDSLTYTYTGFAPRLLYWNSWYWDPEGTSYFLDLITGADESTGALLSLDSTMIDSLNITSHTWDIDGGYSTGAFTQPISLQIGVDGADLLAGVLALTGMDPSTAEAFRNSAIFQNIVRNNQAGDRVLATFGHGQFPAVVPEPASLVLCGTGILTLLNHRRRRRTQRLTDGLRENLLRG